jgi:hypothetical protein
LGTVHATASPKTAKAVSMDTMANLIGVILAANVRNEAH